MMTSDIKPFKNSPVGLGVCLPPSSMLAVVFPKAAVEELAGEVAEKSPYIVPWVPLKTTPPLLAVPVVIVRVAL